MTKHCCGKYPSFVDFWWLDEDGVKPSFTINCSSAKKDRFTGVEANLGTRVSINVDYCPWCGEKLVRDDD